MKRIFILLAAVLAFSAIGATWFDGHGKAEINYAQVRLSTGQLCNPGTCTIFVQDDSTGALRSAVTGTNTGYSGGHYVYPNFNFVVGPWSANAYISDWYTAYVTVWARMPCGSGGFQYTPGDFYYHQNPNDQVVLGNLTLSGHCQTSAPVG